MRLRVMVGLLGLVVGLAGCRNVCMTVLDSCRDDPDAGYSALRAADASVQIPDAGVDAGFPGCINPGCETACNGLDDPRQVCLYPACVTCQRGDGGAGAVFCGRLYTCGRDAGVPADAGHAGSSSSAMVSSGTASSASGSSSAGSASSSVASSAAGSSSAPAASSEGMSSSSAAFSASDSGGTGSSASSAPSSSAPESSSSLSSSSSSSDPGSSTSATGSGAS